MDARAFIAAALQETPRETLQTITGHGKLKSLLKGLLPNTEMDRIFLLPSRYCICLTGVSGSGKRTLAEAFAGSAAQSGYAYYRADACLLREVPEELRGMCIRNLLQQSVSAPGVFLIEPAGDREMLQEIAGAYSMLTEQANAIVLLTEEDPEAAGSIRIPDLMKFEIGAPDQKDREAFFGDIRNRLPRKTNEAGEKVPSYRVLAEGSEGLTYRELTQVIQTIRLQLKTRAQTEYGTDTAALLESLKAGRFYYTERQFSEAVTQARKATQTEVLQRQTERVTDIFAQPDLMPESPLSRRLTEEEAALNELLGELDIPDDPR